MEPISDWTGRLIGGRYKLTKHLYSSRMNSLFDGWDCREGCLVVVKIAHHFLSPILPHLLWCEMYALRRFVHPRIVRLLDAGNVSGGGFFLVLEHLGDRDLDQWLNLEVHGHLPWYLAVDFMVQVLEGLEAIHQSGLVHGDIKPENLMLTTAGPVIVDFGNAKFGPKFLRRLQGKRTRRQRQKAQSSPLRLMRPGIAVGKTPPFASPEQLAGRHDVDHRTDLYACGVVLHEILTGGHPFKEVDSSGPCPFPPHFRVPEQVQAIVWKATALNPTDRYQTAKEMRLVLSAVRRP